MKSRNETLLEAATLLRKAIADRLEASASDANGQKVCSFGINEIRRAACEAVPEVFDTLTPPASPLEAISVWDAAGMGMNDAAFRRWFKDTHKGWVFPETKAKGMALRFS
jgi:hypothetical protein